MRRLPGVLACLVTVEPAHCLSPAGEFGLPPTGAVEGDVVPLKMKMKKPTGFSAWDNKKVLKDLSG